MTLKEFLSNQRQAGITARAWCDKHGLNYTSVMLVAGNHRKAGPEMAKSLGSATGGLVPLSTLRPDLWG